ncbi:MAG: serine esterase [Zetaproteobacteria bacterium]|nr:serine esterase [Pseudobdellovibrionaceae bacterium]
MGFESKVLTSRWFEATPPSKKVLIVLHGRGDSLEGFLWMPQFMQLNVNYLLVNAPDNYYMGYSWYDLPPDQAPGVVRSRKLLDQLFNELEQAGYDDQDMILFGFSQGCMMVQEWGMRSERHLAGCLGVSGSCLDPAALVKEASAAGKARPYLLTHGRYDEVVPFERTQNQVKELKLHFNIDWRTFDKDHTIDEQDEIPLFRSWLKDKFAL